MRQLFNYMPDERYGPILSKLLREGLANNMENGTYLASPRRNLQKVNRNNSVRAFWVFILIRNKIIDFSEAMLPTICTISANSTIYDLIPVADDNIEAINEAVDDLPESNIRLFVVDNTDRIRDIERRFKNDFVFVVGPYGVTDTYEM